MLMKVIHMVWMDGGGVGFQGLMKTNGGVCAAQQKSAQRRRENRHRAAPGTARGKGRVHTRMTKGVGIFGSVDEIAQEC